MIITCPCCKKKFNVDSNLIPNNGRLLKCGTCNETWFFNKEDITTYKTKENYSFDYSLKQKEITNDYSNYKKEKSKDNSNVPTNKGTELVKYRTESSFTISKFFNYLIVIIISFIGIIIILDTFKNPLNDIFPNLELILYNLFETLKDLILFVKDLY
mgnify:FL=1|tara:strand:+ start:97 stop:567 length:471 start_codon:yes stop_codon:yes gene_type:complete